MQRLVTVVKEEQKLLVNKYVIRAIKDTGVKKTVIAESHSFKYPTDAEIGMFLYESKADFAVIEEIFALEEPVLPFE